MRKPENFIGRSCFTKALLFLGIFVFAFKAVLQAQPFGGIVAANGIDLKGNWVTLDSFDSSSSNHSIWQTNFLYHGQGYGVWSNMLSFDTNSAPSRTANAILATDGSLIDVGDAYIAGYVDTAPGDAVSLANIRSVGDLNWVFITNDYGIQSGHQRNDMNIVFSSYSLPIPTNKVQSSWLAVPVPRGGSTNIGGVTYALMITNRTANSNYVYYSIGSTLSQNLFIDASNVVLCLSNGININGAITINTNADVKIWSMGDISSPVILNLTRNVRALSIYDVANYPLYITFSGNAFSIGNIYAPSSSITFNGPGTRRYDIVESIVCDNLQVNGQFNFHFDESLGLQIPPWIVSQSSNQILPAGTNAYFAVAPGGNVSGCQWFFNQTNPIPWATDFGIALTNIQMADAGTYDVVLSNSYGSVTSAPVSLVVFTNATPTLASSFDAVNNWFRFNVAGVTGLKYAIQSSTNLSDWVLMATNVSPFAVTDFNAGTFPQRFYRSVYVP